MAGLLTRIVSNGFWAKDYDIALQRIQKLVEVGLDEINFSTGDDHLEFVPIENIKNATLASLKQNLTVAINVESADDRNFDSNYFFKDTNFNEYLINGKLKILNGMWIPFAQLPEKEIANNEDKILNFHKEHVYLNKYTKCSNIFSGITIDPNYRMLACCGITSKNVHYLDLGDVRQHSIKELYDRQFNDFLKIWIATEGPHKIMDFIAVHSLVDTDYKRQHVCQVCEKIFSNTQYLQILKDNYRKIYSNILIKYFINKRELENEIS
ncbi:MAG: hypothetical protein LBK47_02125 [Prevotellaceae bacterium]|nr:hypothetical protein [Prevotellaceae bacterium]